MSDEPNIVDVAIAAWRMEKWLDNVNVERKMAAKSSLRSLKRYLKDNDIEIVDLTGTRFDVGLAVNVVNNESDEIDEEKLIISEMVKPIIKQNGAVIQYGQVVLGEKVKRQRENKTVETNNDNSFHKDVSSREDDNVLNVSKEKLLDNRQNENIDIDTKCEDSQIVNSKWSIKQILAWVSILVIQLIILILLINTIIGMNTIKNESIINGSKSTETMAVNDNDKDDAPSEIDSRIEAIDNKINVIDSDLKEINSSLSEVLNNELKEQKTSKSNDDYILYIVKSGDSLIKICDDNGIDYYEKKEEILQINNIDDPSVLSIGQIIILPKR